MGIPSLTPRRPSTPNIARLASALAVFAALTLGWASSARAAEYRVDICTPISNTDSGLTIVQNGPALVTQGCDAAIANGIQQQGVLNQPITGGQHWTLNAPAGAKIHTVEAFVSFTTPSTWGQGTPGEGGGLRWRLNRGADAGGGTLMEASHLNVPEAGQNTFDVNSDSLTSEMACPGGSTCLAHPSVVFKNLIAHIIDDFTPTATFGGSLLAGGPVRGSKELSVEVSDQGAGVFGAALSIDGAVQDTFHDPNGGACEPPYVFVQPCKPKLSETYTVNTNVLSEGPHELSIEVVDGANNVSVTPIVFTVHNAPTNTALPLLAGATKIGGLLKTTTGNWDGSPTDFTYQWFRCPAGATGPGAGCSPIVGATGDTFTPENADANQRDLVQVTATNAAGSETATSAPSEAIFDPKTGPGRPPRKPPVISHVTLTRKHFRVYLAGRSTKGRGTILGFSCSRAGHLSLVIERAPRGRKPKPITKLAAPIKSGRSSVLLTGEIGDRTLPPGSYRLTIRVRDAKGVPSAPARVRFTVLPG